MGKTFRVHHFAGNRLCCTGVIKGSEETLHCSRKYLDYDKYYQLSDRKQGALPSRRADIYALFENYQKRKRIAQSYDAADRYAKRQSGCSVTLTLNYRAHTIIEKMKSAIIVSPVDNM